MVPHLSDFNRNSTEWLECQEALSTMYGHTVKLALLSTGRWAVFNQKYDLVAICDRVDDASLKKIFGPAPVPKVNRERARL